MCSFALSAVACMHCQHPTPFVTHPNTTIRCCAGDEGDDAGGEEEVGQEEQQQQQQQPPRQQQGRESTPDMGQSEGGEGRRGRRAPIVFQVGDPAQAPAAPSGAQLTPAAPAGRGGGGRGGFGRGKGGGRGRGG